jgi:hypothetical protein
LDFTVAIATVNRSVPTRFEWYFGILATIGTNRGKHLALGPKAIAIVSVSISLWLPCLTAFGTALGLVNITLGFVKLLIFSAVRESNATIGTLEFFVLKTH